jgi:3-hydroxyisobutyrate dehydrogenase
MQPRLGFIGLGAMGSRIARRLLDAGYPLAVYNRTTDKALPLAAAGAQVCDSPASLAQQSDVVLTMLADDAAVEAVMFNPDGVLAGIRSNATILDLSSIYPATSRSVAIAASKQGVAFLDAPVSGSTPQAEAGNLVAYVGGDADVFERCQPILEVFSGARFRMGPHGAGATMKLVVNGLLGLEMQAPVLTAGQKAKLQNVRDQTYPAQFALRLMWKDLGNVLRLAQEQQVPIPAAAAAYQVFTIEQRKGIEEDFSAVIRTMEELAGVSRS